MTKNKKKKIKHRQVHIGDIAVDTGRIVLADPVTADEVVENLLDNFDDSCYRKGKLNIGYGVIVTTGMGDGIYPVIAVYDDTFPEDFGERVARIYVEFANPFRKSGCQRSFPHDLDDHCFDGDDSKHYKQ